MIFRIAKFILGTLNSSLVSKSKKFSLIYVFFLISLSTYAQYATKHYIAPAPWNYSSAANEFIVSTSSAGAASVTITKSDGTVITTLNVTSGTPVSYRPTGAVTSIAANAVNTIYNN